MAVKYGIGSCIPNGWKVDDLFPVSVLFIGDKRNIDSCYGEDAILCPSVAMLLVEILRINTPTGQYGHEHIPSDRSHSSLSSSANASLCNRDERFGTQLLSVGFFRLGWSRLD